MAEKFRGSKGNPLGDGLHRLNKVLAAAGLGSRRQCDELIKDGRVEVDGEVVSELGAKVDPIAAKIKVDGESLKQRRAVYYAVNKPVGVVSTNNDPEGRPRVIDLVPDRERLFAVGRLDRSSEGLMLLTNDGELAQRLAHPRYEIAKTYWVTVQGQIPVEHLARLERGIHLAEGVARVDRAKIRKQRRHSTDLEIELSEGKNREIRRVLARIGHKVVTLRRTAIGPLRLGDLPIGAARPLSAEEVRKLYVASQEVEKKGSRKRKSGKKRLAPGPIPERTPSYAEEAEIDDLPDLTSDIDPRTGKVTSSSELGVVIDHRGKYSAPKPSFEEDDMDEAMPMPAYDDGDFDDDEAFPFPEAGFDESDDEMAEDGIVRNRRPGSFSDDGDVEIQPRRPGPYGRREEGRSGGRPNRGQSSGGRSGKGPRQGGPRSGSDRGPRGRQRSGDESEVRSERSGPYAGARTGRPRPEGARGGSGGGRNPSREGGPRGAGAGRSGSPRTGSPRSGPRTGSPRTGSGRPSTGRPGSGRPSSGGAGPNRSGESGASRTRRQSGGGGTGNRGSGSTSGHSAKKYGPRSSSAPRPGGGGRKPGGKPGGGRPQRGGKGPKRGGGGGGGRRG